jgi:hypothetical protein
MSVKQPWRPEPPFITHSMEFYQSKAFRSLSNAERKILARIEIEYMKHAGKDNGRLICTYEDFIAYGIRGRSIPAALRHLQAVGAIDMTQRGRRDAMHNPHHYRLTYQPSFDGKWPTNEWHSYRPNGPPTTIKRNSGGISQKPGAKTPPAPGAKTPPEGGRKRPYAQRQTPGAKTPQLSRRSFPSI